MHRTDFELISKYPHVRRPFMASVFPPPPLNLHDTFPDQLWTVPKIPLNQRKSYFDIRCCGIFSDLI